MRNLGRTIKSLSLSAMLLGAMAVMLTGCGKTKLSEGYFTLTEISEGKETVKEKALDQYGLDDAYLVVEDEESGYAVLFGIPVSFSLDSKEGTLEFDTGSVECKASGKKITLSDGNVTMTFEKSKEDAPEKPDGALASSGGANGSGSKPAQGGNRLGGKDSSGDGEGFLGGDLGNSDGSDLDAAEFFAGDWYGWWTLEAKVDDWKELEGIQYDIMGTIDMNDDGTGVLTLWDGGSSYNNPIAKVNVSVEDYMPGYNSLVSNDGFFLDSTLGEGDWHILGNLGGISNYMVIESEYTNSTGVHTMDYVMHLKKWGDKWEDFPTTPPQFDWYINLVENGESMPDNMPE
ncbi:MAG: hypothetical protein IKS87_03660 [Lachnospiraceae bacterium]|nr:hypothetical protein [Lachnospiraceae bacterium]